MKTQNLYVVTAATGNIGREVALRLLQAGKRVRVIGRDKAKLAGLEAKGAEAFVANLEDKTAAAQALAGATAIFALIPPNYQADDFRAYQNLVGEALTHGIVQSGAKHVVSISSIGADKSEGNGPINGLHDQEQRLDRLENVNVVHLRPSYFMENLLMQVPLIKGQGITGGAIDGNVKFPMIATKDIAAVAVEYLLALNFQGKTVRELGGARDISMNDATRAIGEAGKKADLKYITFPYEAAKKAMVDGGLSRSASTALVEMSKAINEGTLKFTQPRSAQSTTPTSIEQFSGVFRALL